MKQTAAEFLFVLCKESGEGIRSSSDGKTWWWSAVCVAVKVIILTHQRACVTSHPFVFALSCSGQSVEVHRIWERSRTSRGSRTSRRRERRDGVLGR